MQDRVPLAEGSSLRILSAQSYSDAFRSESGESETFRRRPVQGLLALSHPQAALNAVFEFWMDVKSFGQARLSLQQLRKTFPVHSGVRFGNTTRNQF